MNADTIVLNPMLAWREIDGCVVVISPEDSCVHEMNEAGSFIWKQMYRRRTIAEIVGLLCDEFQVDFAQAQADTTEFVRMLLGKKLLSN